MLRISPIGSNSDGRTFIKNTPKNNLKYSDSNISFTSNYSDVNFLANSLSMKAKIFLKEGLKGIEKKIFGNGSILKTKLSNGKVVFQSATDIHDNIYKLRYGSDGKLFKIIQKKPDGTKEALFLNEASIGFSFEKLIEKTNAGYLKEFYYNGKESLSKVVEKDSKGHCYEEYLNPSGNPTKIINRVENKECCMEEYYPDGGLAKSLTRDNCGITTTYFYNSQGMLTKVTLVEPNIGEIIQTYDSFGNVAKVVNKSSNGDVLIKFYDGEEHLTNAEIKNFKGSDTKIFYDKDGHVLKSVKKYPEGITKTQQNKFGNVVTSKLENNEGESVFKMLGPDKKLIFSTYTDKQGYSMTITYDDNGGVASFLDLNDNSPPIEVSEFYNLCNKLIPKEDQNSFHPVLKDLRKYFYVKSN